MQDPQKILNQVISVQVWAKGLVKEATQLRSLLEADVSTSTKRQKKSLSPERLANRIANREKTIQQQKRKLSA